MFTTAPGQWLMRVLATHQPEQYIAGALGGEGDLTAEQLAERVEEVLADPVKRQFVLDLARPPLRTGRAVPVTTTTSPGSPRSRPLSWRT